MKTIALFCLSLITALAPVLLTALPLSAAEPPLQRVSVERLVSSSESTDASAALGLDEQIWGESGYRSDRQSLLTAIHHSLRYLDTPAAATAYQRSAVPGVTRERVRRSLDRFRQLVLASRSAAELQAAVLREFDFYQSVGHDGAGTVAFTGYFEPTYTASRVPTAEYRYPLYRLPPTLNQWSQPHPTRQQLEGADGLQGSRGLLRGLELVWLRDRLEAFLVQVQGSARLQLTDGTVMTVGYAGRTEYPYTSIGRELVNAGKFSAEELTLPRLIEHFQQNPEEIDLYVPRNQRFVFFRETAGAPAIGSLGVPVTTERSIATDKTLMPPGALALIQTPVPYTTSDGQLAPRWVNRYVLDQDTGGAIRGAGRVDIFMGTGPEAGDRAGLINGSGQLTYLLLKN